ncbi:aminomethyl-transferring glycine dehydrogenase subunit GcvPB, partial [Candidatus Bathyarchaeota archaeon]|nr:aminomethyl-transferring glycine dehydrogenase subunit GcvPB [Candidatus Bathyarchaeota archaeon]
MFKQADWNEPLIFNLGRKGRKGHVLPKVEEEVRRTVGDVNRLIPENIRRKNQLRLPELSEVEVVRHFTRLSQMNYGIDSGLYPLGSCTMKYNPKVNELLGNLPAINMVHP